MYKVGEVSKISGISVRTLHHYESKGLLLPSERNEAGYRLYTDDDLMRLQQILFYKTLDFSLEGIRNIMCDSNFDSCKALVEQRHLIKQQKTRMQSVLNLIDKTIQQLERKSKMDMSEKFSAFGDFDSKQYEEEAEQQWGDTDSYKESMQRTKYYTKSDWQNITQENSEIIQALADLLENGSSASEEPVLELIEQYRLHFDRWYYPCSKAMHAALGRTYIADQRFFNNYEKISPGLAQFICDASQANYQKN